MRALINCKVIHEQLTMVFFDLEPYSDEETFLHIILHKFKKNELIINY